MKKRPLQIVIVDDEKEIADIIKSALLIVSKHNNIYTFTDSEKAREYVANNNVDILITDYKMPKFDGLQLLEQAPDKVKKVLISGYVSKIAQEKLQKLNAIFFEKPVPVHKVANIILEHEKLQNSK